ncbi:MAG: hypothetical protein ACXACG_18760 [Candidatus Thorarchaeota archaeon]|jgi:hypothetical protein
MKKVGFAVFILLIGFVSIHRVGGSTSSTLSEFAQAQTELEGPTIDWYGQQINESVHIAWDGAYNGQTEEVFAHRIWVNDSDGVDTVIFRYRWVAETEWTNKTGVLIEGNETTGFYNENFTYDVWWNWETGRPETEGNGGNFAFKLFANDTLGNWVETSPRHYSGGYIVVNPPIEYFLFSTVQGWSLIGFTVGTPLIIALLVILRRRKERPIASEAVSFN